MISYYARIPAAAVWREFDGHQYGLSRYAMRDGRIIEAPSGRMLRLCFVTNGEAYLLLGRAGDAIAQPRTNLPFDVTAFHVADCEEQS